MLYDHHQFLLLQTETLIIKQVTLCAPLPPICGNLYSTVARISSTMLSTIVEGWCSYLVPDL
jgi:hypothetical protein